MIKFLQLEHIPGNSDNHLLNNCILIGSLLHRKDNYISLCIFGQSIQWGTLKMLSNALYETFKLMNAIFKQPLPENVNKQQFFNILIYILFR